MAFWNRIRRRKEKQKQQETTEILSQDKAGLVDDAKVPDAADEEPVRLSQEELAAEHIIPKGKAEQKRYLSHSHIMCKISQDRGSCSAEEIERNGVTYGVEVKYG